MTLTDEEFEAIMGSVKVINSDITWRRREGRGYALSFRAEANIEHKGRMFLPPPYHKEMPR